MRVYWVHVDDGQMLTAEAPDDAIAVSIGGPCPHHGSERRVVAIDLASRVFRCGDVSLSQGPKRRVNAVTRHATHPMPPRRMFVEGTELVVHDPNGTETRIPGQPYTRAS